MTKTYHDVQAVTLLLEEKEKDLELAARIGQELLQRNKESDEKVSKLEGELALSGELVTQLQHELQVKTDLLNTYTDEVEDSCPQELRGINIGLLERKITDLEEENSKLHMVTYKLEHEAIACEEKEEQLVKEAVQELTQANFHIGDLHDQLSGKVDETSRQREEINKLLFQVCDLQKRVQHYSHENEDITANLRFYEETQENLTTELVDVKEKYREVVELFKDAQEEIRKSRKTIYQGVGGHTVSGMFPLISTSKNIISEDSLQAELSSSKKIADVDIDDGPRAVGGSAAYRKAARTLRAISKKTPTGMDQTDSINIPKKSDQHKSILSPDGEDDEHNVDNSFETDCHDISEDSGNGRSTGLSQPISLSSSAPKEESAREWLKQATKNSLKISHADIQESDNIIWSLQPNSNVGIPSHKKSMKTPENVEVIQVQTVGALRRPSFHMSSSLLQSTPLGSLPGAKELESQAVGHPFLGTIPGKTYNTQKKDDAKISLSDLDELEDHERYRPSRIPPGGHPSLGVVPGMVETASHPYLGSSRPHQKSKDAYNPATYDTFPIDFDETEPVGGLTISSVPITKIIEPPDADHYSRSTDEFNVSEEYPELFSPSKEQSGSNPTHVKQTDLGYGLKSDVFKKGESEYNSISLSNIDSNTKGTKLHDISSLTSSTQQFSGDSVSSWRGTETHDIKHQEENDYHDIEAIFDEQLTELGNYPGMRVISERETDLNELEMTLKQLNPLEVERSRVLMSKKYNNDLVSEDRGSPGAIAGCEEYFNSLPYGVEPSDRLMTYQNKNLPKKLRIVKPLEGSLTLHHWSRLATPHLGGVLEERVGVAVKGNEKASFERLLDIFSLSDVEESDGEEICIPSDQFPTKPQNTLTNSTVLHPDTTQSTNTYGGLQMSSGMPSQQNSPPSSRLSIYPDYDNGNMPLLPTYESGKSKLLDETNISKARRSQKDIAVISNLSSLTPSVLTTPMSSKNISPTSTPCHTPEESFANPPESEGFVHSFFSSLKAAIYGVQRKHHKTPKQSVRIKKKRPSLGILEAIEEAGITNILCEKENTPMSMPDLSIVGQRKDSKWPRITRGPSELSDFDARYLGVLDDFDELKDIRPGLITLTSSTGPARDPQEYTKEWIGQLTVPIFTSVGRPSLEQKELGRLPTIADHQEDNVGEGSGWSRLGGRGPGRMVRPGELRPSSQTTVLGVPAHPGTRAVEHASWSRRKDLGTIPGVLDGSLDTGRKDQDQRSIESKESDSFIGSITNMFFGRKGGYL